MQYQMPSLFYKNLLAQATRDPAVQNTQNIWGVVIPHHQLAAEVMAQTLKQIADNDYRQIFIVSPDHFNRGTSKISLTEVPLIIATGTTNISAKNITALKNISDVGDADGFITYEHGIGTPLPFVEALWPEAQITALTIRGDATPNDLKELTQFLQTESQNPKTLIIESSDFSHYLTPQQAHQKDLQTIETLQQNDPAEILKLKQPDNCDSVNILYIMKSLQISTGGKLNIYLNKNSQDFTKEKVTSSTSYITFYLSK
jgi:poly-gamma-glutamate synthesis protein (capsule biosynthesis protein)